MNGNFLINNVGHVCFHIHHKSQKKLLFFQLPNLEHDFMIADFARLNLAILKKHEVRARTKVM